MKSYANSNDFNHMFCHQRNEVLEDKIKKLLYDNDALIEACDCIFKDILEYELFTRCLSEQTIAEDGKPRLRTKEDGIMNSIMLQNPSDPEATYRNKAGKIHRGYAANIDKSANASGSVVSDYRYEQNIHSDSQFLRKSVTEAKISEDMVTLITDGDYGGGNNTELAKEKNIDLITADLVGKDTPNVLADFQFSEDGTKLEKCAAAHFPEKRYYTKSIKQERYMEKGDFAYYARLRNGVETILFKYPKELSS